jgi:hypothetical protein
MSFNGRRNAITENSGNAPYTSTAVTLNFPIETTDTINKRRIGTMTIASWSLFNDENTIDCLYR